MSRFAAISAEIAAAAGWPGEASRGLLRGKAFLGNSRDEWTAVIVIALDATAAMIHLLADHTIHLGGGNLPTALGTAP